MKTQKKRLRLQIEGMSCANCAAGIKRQLEKEGLQNVNINFATREASCDLSLIHI